MPAADRVRPGPRIKFARGVRPQAARESRDPPVGGVLGRGGARDVGVHDRPGAVCLLRTRPVGVGLAVAARMLPAAVFAGLPTFLERRWSSHTLVLASALTR